MDSLDEYTERLEALNDEIVNEQNRPHTPLLSGFVTFKSSRSVVASAQLIHSAHPVRCVVNELTGLIL